MIRRVNKVLFGKLNLAFTYDPFGVGMHRMVLCYINRIPLGSALCALEMGFVKVTFKN